MSWVNLDLEEHEFREIISLCVVTLVTRKQIWVKLGDLQSDRLREKARVATLKMTLSLVLDPTWLIALRTVWHVLEGLRVNSWRSGDSIAWTSGSFIYFAYVCLGLRPCGPRPVIPGFEV
ncbi:hypothetical protein CsSME_00011015 [Camellia sinensis var. sinensis]